MHVFRSAYATLEYEIAEERVSALARLGQRLEAALAALAACPRTANSDRNIREGLVEQAGEAPLLFVVQRGGCGLHKNGHVVQGFRGADEGGGPLGAIVLASMD